MKRKIDRRMLQEHFETRVGYVYDIRMRYHCSLDDAVDDPHPEDPRRTHWIYNLLEKSDLINLMHQVQIYPATNAQILRVHKSKYIEALERTELMERDMLITEQEKYDSVYLCAESYYCAKMSAGALIALCQGVASGQVDCGFAIVRPPGHHACKSEAMGFCLLNNVGIAVEDLFYNMLAKRIMVVDWDVHHGNGIQKMFIKNRDVLYCSLHRYDGGEFYPGSKEGSMDQVGEEPAAGFNINIPWVASGMGDGDYMYAFKNLVLPVAREFKPDIIIVAAGFDAAVNDPIGECAVTPECYAAMTSMLKEVCGKIVLSLEGGYNLDAVSNSALGCIKALLGVKWKAGFIPEAASYNGYATLSAAEVNGVPMSKHIVSPSWKAIPDWSAEFEVVDAYNAEPSTLGKDVVDQVINIHKKYWTCLHTAE